MEQTEAIMEETAVHQGRIEAKILPYFLIQEVAKSGIFMEIPIDEQIIQMEESVKLMPWNEVLREWLQILVAVKHSFDGHLVEMQMYRELEAETQEN